MKSCITINLKKDDIVIKINEDFSQEDILYSLRKKIPELKKLYQSEKTPIVITGKVLKNREIDEIQELIKKHFDVKIKFDSPRTLGLHGITKTYCKEIATSETKFHRGSVRSGQKVEFEGSLVILGDVNDGAEVIACKGFLAFLSRRKHNSFRRLERPCTRRCKRQQRSNNSSILNRSSTAKNL